MDNGIIDVVLGLALIYAIVSLLAMKLQETLTGNLMRRRVSTLHQLVLEAVGQDAALKNKVMNNPLVFALFKGSSAKQGMFSRGPSAIPPDLFARSLLMELNGGAHPSGQFSTPTAFLAAKAPAETPLPKIWGSMAGLIAGRETSWPAFEGAIADWFTDIGDRSEGWFQREAMWTSLGLAFVLAAALNIDTVHIAATLSTDPEMRQGLADLAERVNAEKLRSDGKTPSAAPADDGSAVRPMTQVSAGMVDAITRLTDAFVRDKVVAEYQFNLVELKSNCAILMGQEVAGSPSDLAASGALVVKRDATLSRRAGVTPESFLSNSDIWLNVLPLLMSRIESAQLDPDTAPDLYRGAFRCIAHVSSWVRSAVPASSDSQVRTLMQEAAVALESAKSGLLALLERQRSTQSVRRLFLADPEVFRDCASGSRVTRAGFETCMARGLAQQVRLPIGPWGATTRQQFCKAVEAKPACAAPGLAPIDASKQLAACPAAAVLVQAPAPDKDGGYFCNASYEGNPDLGIPAIRLAYAGDLAGLGGMWLLGIAITAFFVSLGAPFWFDVLSRVVNIRATGRKRTADENALRGKGTLPPPPPAATRDTLPAVSGPDTTPFADARNRFEDNLVVRDVVSLQLALKVEATGRLDTATRNAIAAFCKANGVPGTDELDLILFEKIVRRTATNSPVLRSGNRATSGQASGDVKGLAASLTKLLDFPGRIATDEARFTPDLRALAVLYRYKKEDGTPPQDRAVVKQAVEQPAALDEIDDALAIEIKLAAVTPAAKFARDSAGWLDWALGELGQLERDSPRRDTSNPRICEYLDTAVKDAGNGGDRTAWCGAFAAWVLKKHIATLDSKDPTQSALQSRLQPVADPLLAIHWKTWGSGDRGGAGTTGAAAARQALPGDLVLFKPTGPDSTGHVAFVVKTDTAGSRIWVVGGNQTHGSCVSVTSFEGADVVCVRQP